jgi:very-short-patch-repair endonuclease
LVRVILEQHNIRFVEQKTFADLTHKNKLRCDFYLPDYNTVIEYNGLQHYEPISIFGGIEALIQTQNRDVIKYNYLEANNINLVIIRYDNNNVSEYLINQLGNILI